MGHWDAGEFFWDRAIKAKSEAGSSSKVWSGEVGPQITRVSSMVVVEGVIRAKAWSKSAMLSNDCFPTFGVVWKSHLSGDSSSLAVPNSLSSQKIFSERRLVKLGEYPFFCIGGSFKMMGSACQDERSKPFPDGAAMLPLLSICVCCSEPRELSWFVAFAFNSNASGFSECINWLPSSPGSVTEDEARSSSCKNSRSSFCTDLPSAYMFWKQRLGASLVGVAGVGMTQNPSCSDCQLWEVFRRLHFLFAFSSAVGYVQVLPLERHRAQPLFSPLHLTYKNAPITKGQMFRGGKITFFSRQKSQAECSVWPLGGKCWTDETFGLREGGDEYSKIVNIGRCWRERLFELN